MVRAAWAAIERGRVAQGCSYEGKFADEFSNDDNLRTSVLIDPSNEVPSTSVWLIDFSLRSPWDVGTSSVLSMQQGNANIAPMKILRIVGTSFHLRY